MATPLRLENGPHGPKTSRLNNRTSPLLDAKELNVELVLIHISLASFLWNIGKQNNPRSDAAFCGVPSDDILFA